MSGARTADAACIAAATNAASSSAASGLGSAPVAGVAIACLIIGALLVFVVMFLLGRKQSPTDEVSESRVNIKDQTGQSLFGSYFRAELKLVRCFRC